MPIHYIYIYIYIYIIYIYIYAYTKIDVENDVLKEGKYTNTLLVWAGGKQQSSITGQNITTSYEEDCFRGSPYFSADADIESYHLEPIHNVLIHIHTYTSTSVQTKTPA